MKNNLTDRERQGHPETSQPPHPPQDDYRARRVEVPLSVPQPQLEPTSGHKAEDDPVRKLGTHNGSGLKLGGWLLVLAVVTLLVFSVVDAGLFLHTLWASMPFLAAGLAVLLALFISVLVLFIVREWRGYIAIGRFINSTTTLDDCQAKGDRDATLAFVRQRAAQVAKTSFSAQCFADFEHRLRPHHSNSEVIQIYRERVVKPIHAEAAVTLKKVSMTSGGLAFLSPNGLIQSTLFIWMSLRTLRLIARVYGLRGGWAANVRLLKVALENLAITSALDLLSDELTSQLGGAIGAKVLENSAEAMAAGGLNYRLGKALIRELSQGIV
ncbi:MAG: DUF697 domain-containing protein [Hydrogenovibrio sp.]